MVGRVTGALAIGLLLGALGAQAAAALKRAAADEGETERQVKEEEVPRAALETLKKIAGGATISGFSEEVEHGHKFYEGSWKQGDGNVDCLVTEDGDLVEIEEAVGYEKVPEAVRRATRKEAGGDAKLAFERKTCILYEVKFRKGERLRELLLTPDGRTTSAESDDDDDDGDEDEDDDDDDDDDDKDDKR